MRILLILFSVGLSSHLFAQNLTATELLNKSISYHDPDNNWVKFHAMLKFTDERPGQKSRYSEVELDNTKSFFRLKQQRGETTIEREAMVENCTNKLNGSLEISDEDMETHRLSCDRTLTLRNYYLYLNGLPMKLKDEGTILDPEVKKTEFMGKSYLQLKVTYDAEVGSDTWYFYIHPETYALEGYRFYHDESINDGEYIVLEDEMEVQGIKLAKKRKWYTNKEQKHLGTDVLSSVKAME